MYIELSPRKIFVILLSVIGFMSFAHLMGMVSKHVFGHDFVYGIVPLFDFGMERNIPTLYSSLQLVLASSFLSVIGAKHRSNGEAYVSWLVLAVIFLFLAIDETAEIHERLIEPFRTIFGLSGLLYFAWVIPYGVAVFVLVIAFSRFLLRLPKETMWRFIASGVIYVTGAIGFEMLGASHFEVYGSNNVVYSILYTCEELLEMVGIALFVYALLAYISNQLQFLQFTIRD